MLRYDSPSCCHVNDALSEDLDHVRSITVFQCYGTYMLVDNKDAHILPEEMQADLVEYIPDGI